MKIVVFCNILSGTCHGKINEPGVMAWIFANTVLSLKEELQIICSFVTCSLKTANICHYIGAVFITSSKSLPEVGPGDREA